MIPDWLRSIRERFDAHAPAFFVDHPAPPDPLRASAVLVLFWRDPTGAIRLVLTERAHDLRSHAAQVVFPGGHIDPGETPVQAALREANEEIGLETLTVEVIDELPGIYLQPPQAAVVPVLAWWHSPHPVGVVDPREVRRVLLPTLDQLVDPNQRFTATAPGGFTGLGFFVEDLVVWGLTAELLEAILELGRRVQPWDESVTHPLPYRLLAAYAGEFQTPS
ncbi:MAG: CoA pyrophosphatase [Propionibacteriaceae bacterium]|nr:CoA pyrophosphatase [Propionibacteriaceae bacterium]